jgi:hypothetical protein
MWGWNPAEKNGREVDTPRPIRLLVTVWIRGRSPSAARYLLKKDREPSGYATPTATTTSFFQVTTSFHKILIEINHENIVQPENEVVNTPAVYLFTTEHYWIGEHWGLLL